MANQAWQLASPGNLRLVNLGPSLPQPGPRQALIRIGAASLNYRDKLIISGSPDYPIKPDPDLTPCSDGAGVVEKAGPDSVWKKGDRVVLFFTNWLKGNDSRDLDMTKIAGSADMEGTLRRYLVWDDEKLVRAPSHLSIQEACTLMCAGMTAYRAVFRSAMNIGPGTTVLTQGTGGVSCYAIQFAAAAGAEVIALSSSEEKLHVAEKLGAKHLINYRSSPDWTKAVLEVTHGKGVDLVVDVVGAEFIKQTLAATRHGGHVVLVGNLSNDPNMAVDIMHDILYGAKKLEGQLGAGSCECAIEMAEFMEKHQIHPQIARTYKFEEAKEAIDLMGSVREAGKIVIEV